MSANFVGRAVSTGLVGETKYRLCYRSRVVRRHEDDTRPLAEVIHRKTGRNAFFVVRYLRLLYEIGAGMSSSSLGVGVSSFFQALEVGHEESIAIWTKSLQKAQQNMLHCRMSLAYYFDDLRLTEEKISSVLLSTD
jgi:hypothetical protein